jgi:hypothetical protein
LIVAHETTVCEERLSIEARVEAFDRVVQTLEAIERGLWGIAMPEAELPQEASAEVKALVSAAYGIAAVVARLKPMVTDLDEMFVALGRTREALASEHPPAVPLPA